MSLRYPAILALVSLSIGAATVGLVTAVADALRRLYVGPTGPYTVDDEAMEQYQTDIESLSQFIQLAQPTVGPLVLAALIPAIGAIVLLAVRAQRASASATASREASVAS